MFISRGVYRPWLLEANAWRVVELCSVIWLLFWATVNFATRRSTSSHKQVLRPASLSNPFTGCCMFYFAPQTWPSHRERTLLFLVPLIRMLRLDIWALRAKVNRCKVIIPHRNRFFNISCKTTQGVSIWVYLLVTLRPLTTAPSQRPS